MRPTTQRIRLPRGSIPASKTQIRDSFCPRQFSHKPPKLILVSTRASTRPQLPFLHPSGSYVSSAQLSRLFSISASQKKFIKDTARDSVKWTLIFGTVSVSFSLAGYAILTERQERAFPSPHEWSFITRFRFRRGKWWQVPENNEKPGATNWPQVYEEMLKAVERLEDVNKDGAGIVEQDQEEGGLLVPGVGKAGYDVTAKSEEWRQGYWEALMGLALAAENQDGWVTTASQKYYWSPAYVPTPQNPYPPDVLPGGIPLPPEEERIPAAGPPETFYMKLLTTKGFTTSQRVRAALGCAHWLTFKELTDSAEEMYRWALDIAISGLPTPDKSSVIDSKTGVLSSTASKEHITPNLIFAATELATFHASQGNTTAALPILVSLLRARLEAPEAPATEPPKRQEKSMISEFINLLVEPVYPPLPPTGDEPFLRIDTDRCEEAALKTYIGEILFATAGPTSYTLQTAKTPGLSWVRDSVSTAKQAQSIPGIQAEVPRRRRCETCEEVGLEAWGKIMTYLAAQAKEDLEGVKRGWGPRALAYKLLWGTDALEARIEDLEEEEDGVAMRLHKLRVKVHREETAEHRRKYARTFVF
ncbi:hypothetical protein DM02DRAFT_618530 [Periconia macrospinosa]|uniref:Uncharacterized protein n=1 Tax=Periconia macrospinosa TaxID=97972 RepID=A0A2V1D8X6_9PLEO|nr:hypothetical protein DM02DRAFT_618530 [Periconia macrospinosa]